MKPTCPEIKRTGCNLLLPGIPENLYRLAAAAISCAKCILPVLDPGSFISLLDPALICGSLEGSVLPSDTAAAA